MNVRPPNMRLSSKDGSVILTLETVGREFPSVEDYWDGNWILFKISFIMPGLNVEFTDPCIRTDELEGFLEELKSLSLGHSQVAESIFSEPILYIYFQVSEPGSEEILGKVDISLFSEEGIGNIAVEMDLNYDSIDTFIRGIEEVLREYPVLDRDTH
jgi:hypothetical protein